MRYFSGFRVSALVLCWTDFTGLHHAPQKTLSNKYHINRLIKPLQNGRKMFYGPSGWKLGWESADKLWKISNERSESSIIIIGLGAFQKLILTRFPEVTANLTVSSYPLGANTWTIAGTYLSPHCSPDYHLTQLTDAPVSLMMCC